MTANMEQMDFRREVGVDEKEVFSFLNCVTTFILLHVAVCLCDSSLWQKGRFI